MINQSWFFSNELQQVMKGLVLTVYLHVGMQGWDARAWLDHGWDARAWLDHGWWRERARHLCRMDKKCWLCVKTLLCLWSWMKLGFNVLLIIFWIILIMNHYCFHMWIMLHIFIRCICIWIYINVGKLKLSCEVQDYQRALWPCEPDDLTRPHSKR